MQFLTFDLSESSDGWTTLEAMASTSAELHPSAMAEAQQLLAWAWQQFPGRHGPVDEGMDWDHDLQVHVEPGGWHAVTLTLAGSPSFFEALFDAFGDLLAEPPP